MPARQTKGWSGKFAYCCEFWTSMIIARNRSYSAVRSYSRTAEYIEPKVQPLTLRNVTYSSRPKARGYRGIPDRAAFDFSSPGSGNTIMKLLMIAFAALCFAMPGIAGAAGTQKEQDACARDAERYCRPLLSQGDLVVLGCLQQNRQRLKNACQAVLRNNGV